VCPESQNIYRYHVYANGINSEEERYDPVEKILQMNV
jgi:hypothetical protein